MRSPAVTSQAEGATRVPNPRELVEQTREVAEQIYEAVAAEYLEFRREYYHEANPSLDTIPPAHEQIRQAEIAQLVDRALRLVPAMIKAVPIIGSFLTHLEQVAEIHSISEDERTALHNMARAFLYGIDGGIQPWYVEWILASARNLIQMTDPQYYMQHPWDGLLYMPPATLEAFDAAVRTGNVEAITREIDYLGGRLIEVLRDPIHTQPEFAFTGPNAEQRRLRFNLRTGVALALMAYLIMEEVRHIAHPQRSEGPLPSVLAQLPHQLSERMIPHYAREHQSAE